jgi:hypothetical protein
VHVASAAKGCQYGKSSWEEGVPGDARFQRERDKTIDNSECQRSAAITSSSHGFADPESHTESSNSKNSTSVPSSSSPVSSRSPGSQPRSCVRVRVSRLPSKATSALTFHASRSSTILHLHCANHPVDPRTGRLRLGVPHTYFCTRMSDPLSRENV